MRSTLPVCLSIWVAVFLAVGARAEESIGNDSIRIEWDASLKPRQQTTPTGQTLALPGNEFAWSARRTSKHIHP